MTSFSNSQGPGPHKARRSNDPAKKGLCKYLRTLLSSPGRTDETTEDPNQPSSTDDMNEGHTGWHPGLTYAFSRRDAKIYAFSFGTASQKRMRLYLYDSLRTKRTSLVPPSARVQLASALYHLGACLRSIRSFVRNFFLRREPNPYLSPLVDDDCSDDPFEFPWPMRTSKGEPES